MLVNNLFDNEIKERFEKISSKMYNFKHSFRTFINDLEDNTDIPLGYLCLLLILQDYFNEIKKDYNKLEEDLGVLL